MDIDMITHEAAFAKVVTTERGEALMIARHVFEVTGPKIDGQSPASVLAQVLRRNSIAESVKPIIKERFSDYEGRVGLASDDVAVCGTKFSDDDRALIKLSVNADNILGRV